MLHYSKRFKKVMSQDNMVKTDYEVDARGEACPMPLLRAKLQLNNMAEGESVKLLATDAGSVRDFEAFIGLTSHDLVCKHTEDEFIYFITKR